MANLCFSIPGNIKQQMLPFVINPSAPINHNVNGGLFGFQSSSLLSQCSPQWFTFKYKTGDFPAGCERLQICPSSLDNVNFGEYFNQDISYKLLFGRNSNGSMSDTSIMLSDLFQSLPEIQIREFLPDTRLDQCINLFADILEELWKSGKQVVGDIGKVLKGMLNQDASWSARLSAFGDILANIFKFIIGISVPNLFENRNGEFRYFKLPNGMYHSVGVKESLTNNINLKVVDFPFLMYYQLQSCVTSNIYEVPGLVDSKTVFSANGSAGWKGGKGFGAATLDDSILGKLPLVKKVVDNVLGNVQINWMPLWDPKEGSSAQHPKLTIKFDLFNDTADAARRNFLFVNTLVPNNMYIQYGMFQHSSPLYDVRIAGLERMYACSGSFTVNYGGDHLRNPPKKWIEDLVANHANSSEKKLYGGRIDKEKLLAAILDNNLIKIPDVYSVQMEFDSLLPNNFNSYIFNYTHNVKMETTHSTGGVWQPSRMASNNLTEALADFREYMTNESKESLAKIEQADEENRTRTEFNKRMKEAQERKTKNQK